MIHDHETCVVLAHATGLSLQECCDYAIKTARARREMQTLAASERRGHEIAIGPSVDLFSHHTGERTMRPTVFDNIRSLAARANAAPTVSPGIAEDVNAALAAGVAEEDIRAAIRATFTAPDPSQPDPAVEAAARAAKMSARELASLRAACRRTGMRVLDAIPRYAATRDAMRRSPQRSA